MPSKPPPEHAISAWTGARAMEPAMPQRMMNIDQVARYLRVTPQRVNQLVLQGELPCGQTGRHTMFRRRDVDAWASQHIMSLRERGLSEFHRAASKQTEREDHAPFAVFSMLTPARTIAALQSHTKAAVLRDLAAVAEKESLLYDPKDLVRSLEEREALCSTGLAGGVAIVHPRNHDPYIASEPFIVMARAAHPIGFGAPDGKPTDIFFLLVATNDRYHLQSLARLCMMMTNTTLLADLRQAETSGEMYDAALRAEGEILASLAH